jgi:hypothetical protein
LAVAAGLLSFNAVAGKNLNGNGAPSGAHYNLNIIGMDRDSDADGSGNGHRIFVKLWGNTKIMLTEGDFAVLDYNGLDGEASFQLPAADADCDGESDYSVFVRAPGARGHADVTTCMYDLDTGDEYCNLDTVHVEAGPRPKFTNVSKTLLTVTADLDDDGRIERTPLFGDDAYGYFWDYDNHGLRLAQFRFYDEYATLLDDADGSYDDYNCNVKGNGN